MKIIPLSGWKNRMPEFSGRSGKVAATPFLSDGKEYHVYGIGWRKDSYYYANSPVVYIFDDYDNLVLAPLLIFDITEGELPTQWRISGSSGGFLMCPDLFRSEFFFDDFSEKEPSLVKEVAALRREIEGLPDASEGSDSTD